MKCVDDTTKMPNKLKKRAKKFRKEQETSCNFNKEVDWRCLTCDNLNYGFRDNCNRCWNKKVVA